MPVQELIAARNFIAGTHTSQSIRTARLDPNVEYVVQLGMRNIDIHDPNLQIRVAIQATYTEDALEWTDITSNWWRGGPDVVEPGYTVVRRPPMVTYNTDIMPQPIRIRGVMEIPETLRISVEAGTAD